MKQQKNPQGTMVIFLETDLKRSKPVSPEKMSRRFTIQVQHGRKKSVTHGGKPLRMVFADNKERGNSHASLQTSYHRRAGKAIPNEKFRV